jgi:hypothetical protein
LFSYRDLEEVVLHVQEEQKLLWEERQEAYQGAYQEALHDRAVASS